MLVLERQEDRWYHRRGWLLAGAIAITLVVLFGGETRSVATRVYREHRQRRALRQAEAFSANQDHANAALALQVALEADPQNAGAWRAAAGVLERAGDPRALELRRQVLEANPDSMEALLALAATALRFNDTAQAEASLARVPSEQADQPAVLRLRAALSIAQGKPDAARQTLETLTKIDPSNAVMRFNLAALELQYGDALTKERARDDVTKYANDVTGPLRLAALRELARDAAERGDLAGAIARLDLLITLSGSSFADELLRLDLVTRANESRLAAVQAEVAMHAARSAEKATTYAAWLIVRKRAVEARAWLESLPPTVVTERAVGAVRADCLGQAGDWSAMSEALVNGAWGSVRADAIRQAILARSKPDVQPTDRRAAWNKVLMLAGDDLTTHRVLLRLARLWKWEEETDQTLLAIMSRFPDQSWVFKTLVSAAFARRDAGELKVAYDAWHRAHPGDARVAGDWAMITLLLEPSPLPSDAKETDHRLHAAAPKDPFYATADALAHYQRHEAKEALAIMERLGTTDLAVPGRALYHGLFLAAAAQKVRARAALELAQRAPLLPAERRLLDEGWAMLADRK